MPRTSVTVDRERLIKAIEQAESKGPLKNLSVLWEDASVAYNDPKVTPSVVYLRAREWALPVKTQPGKRGRAGATPATSREKGARIELPTFDMLRKEYPEHKRTIDKAERGSLKAAIKLKCIDCSNNQKQEIKECMVKGCSLYPFRPWR